MKSPGCYHFFFVEVQNYKNIEFIIQSIILKGYFVPDLKILFLLHLRL
jgi:hypothetical protein